MKLLRNFLSILILTSVAAISSLAEPNPKLEPASKLIPNLASALVELKTRTHIPVIFPKAIPHDKGIVRYYANIDLPEQPAPYNFVVNIDATPDCNGVHVCNLGYLRAKRGGKPEMYQDQEKRNITVPVTLVNDTKAYFTPGHAIGSFFPALIEWQQDGVLYSLSWSLAPDAEKDSLIEMANSAISSLQH